MAAAAARAFGRAVWNAAKQAGRIAMPDSPVDAAEVVKKVIEVARIWTGHGDRTLPPPISQEDRIPPYEDMPIMDPAQFGESYKTKVLKALVAVGAIYGVHKLDLVARNRPKHQTVGLFVAIDPPAMASAAITKTAKMVPSDAATAASLLAGPVGVRPGNGNPVPRARPDSAPRFDPAGFLFVVLLPWLYSLFEE